MTESKLKITTKLIDTFRLINLVAFCNQNSNFCLDFPDISVKFSGDAGQKIFIDSLYRFSRVTRQISNKYLIVGPIISIVS